MDRLFTNGGGGWVDFLCIGPSAGGSLADHGLFGRPWSTTSGFD